MKIVILGGGPAGLFCGLLMKKTSPSHDITIIERNPPDATYGWGVVFSERTLGAVQDADMISARAITDRFVLWDAIHVHYRGQVIRCGGQIYAGIARKALLGLLQRRCDELGVAMRFRTEIADLAAVADADAVIAADGINSVVRKTFEGVFKPRVELGKARYIWYGTTRWLDAFTFIFKENAHGLFQVHAYPFDGATGTFIVECAEDVWRRAGLDQAGEAESIAYCERLFARELGGRRLLSNNSRWINFATVTCARWHHRNIVLLGDSAHTAHFSIGSGTKLAMEDAIALANAFGRHRDVETAFNEFEATRRPAVEAFQQAAAESRIYFENIRRYLHLDPPQFTFHLLTRSGRISYEALRLRDPSFGSSVDRWFGGIAANPGLVAAPPPFLTPFAVRGMQVPNRVVLAVAPAEDATDGLPTERRLCRMLHLAERGAGLVMTDPVAVSAGGRITAGCPGLYDRAHAEAWGRLVTTIHEKTRARVALHLNHAGRRGSTRPRRNGLDRPLRYGGWPLLAPSAIPYTARAQAPKAMERADMDRVRNEFAAAARLADAAGFDMLVLHAGGGYLLAGFISPLANLRQDEYGGPLGNRLRFPLEVLDAVRAAWPADRPLGVSFTADDCAPGGLPAEDAAAAVRAFHAHGADIIHVLAGHTVPDAHPAYGRGFLTATSDLVRNEARVPTVVGGLLVTADEINTILAAGRADLCIMDPPDLNGAWEPDRERGPDREEEASTR